MQAAAEGVVMLTMMMMRMKTRETRETSPRAILPVEKEGVCIGRVAIDSISNCSWTADCRCRILIVDGLFLAETR
jgi:hypothetical protein